ncbi:MAG: DNA cytosine methyltransferase [Acidobacteriota bacterium]
MTDHARSEASPQPAPLRVLELYCGIGGCSAALAGQAESVAAIDINRQALDVYRYNFSHPVVAGLVESVEVERLQQWAADLWWLSPPCQPFTRRGKQRDLDDPRAQTFLASLERLAAVRPAYVALENVPPFRRSRARDRLLDTLTRAGYGEIREQVLCPTELGRPNRRRRYYLLASRRPLAPASPLPKRSALTPLSLYLDPEPLPDLTVDPALVERYRGALHIVHGEDPTAVTHCFTSAYGRSPVRSGSYLATSHGIRRFAPTEILRLLGFPAGFRLPAELPRANAWRLVANSLSIDAVRHVLAPIPELGG